MNDLGDTTGMQNPIFRIMQNQTGGQNSQGMAQNPMNLNLNSMNPPQMGMNQMPNSMGNNNSLNQIQSPMNMNLNSMNNQQQPQQQGLNLGNNQMQGQSNQMAQMMGNNMGQQTGVNNPMMQQQMMQQPMMGNSGLMDNNAMTQLMQQQMMQQQMMQQQMMQQQMLQQQMMQQQMMAVQAQANKQAQMNNILNNVGQGNNAPVNQGSEQNQPQQQSGGGFSVIFRASAETGPASAPIMIQCMPNEKVSTIIDRYRAKSGDKDPTKKFIFNAKNLAPSLTLSEAGISNNANIFVVATKGIKGAF